MKKVLLGLCAISIILVSCEKEQNETNPIDSQEITVDMSDFSLYVDKDDLTGKSANSAEKCASMKNLEYRLAKNKGLAKKMYDIEYSTRKAIALKKGGGKPGGGGGTDPVIYEEAISIPVVINIIETSAGDVTQQQIDSQIVILNEDFGNTNPKTSDAPSPFSGLVADVRITFTLAAVNRRTNTQTNWGTNDSMKYTSQGGIDVTAPAKNLNIWIVNKMATSNGEILGYAQFPGGAEDTDGVVLGKNFFGETGGVYGDGRTATHEVGHWLNLRHIWGDGRCNRDDYVSDTPSSDRSNGGCPAYPTVHCRTADMTMNYMDYVYDDCMYMFTLGQNDRMRALFASGQPRVGFVN